MESGVDLSTTTLWFPEELAERRFWGWGISPVVAESFTASSANVYNGRVYQTTYTEITFDKNPYEYASGTGTWVDYYDDYGWETDYVANHITWEVSNRVIRIWFRNERTYMEIRDYSLSDTRFEGTIYEDGHYVDFWMTKIARPYKYSSYRWDYYDYDYYWARTRAEGGDTTEVRDMPIRFLNPEQK